jgi:hypothetical protein
VALVLLEPVAGADAGCVVGGEDVVEAFEVDAGVGADAGEADAATGGADPIEAGL